jgi:hypothetical protein
LLIAVDGIHAAGRAGSITSTTPILFGLALYRWRIRIFDFQPKRRPAPAIDRAEPLRHDPLASEPASLMEYGLAVLLVMLVKFGRKEYATHLNFTGGRVVSELTVEYTFATNQPIKFRDRALRRYTRCPDLTTLVTILRALNYEGLCCFNYKMLDGVGHVVFELNPRMGGSLGDFFLAFVGAISYPRK